MSNHPASVNELRLLLAEAMDGRISQEKESRMNELLRHDPGLRQYYLHYLDLQVYVKCIYSNKTPFLERAPSEYDDLGNLNLLLYELAKQEQQAETIVIEKPIEQKAPMEPVHIQREPRHINKFSLITAVTSLAALLCLIAYVYLNPRIIPQRTAMVTDSMNVKWAEGTRGYESPNEFYNTDDKRILSSGVLKLAFEDGAHAVIEGPAIFSCPSASLLKLDSGKIFAHVPPEASGFTISTPTSRIIDLGTRFGVDARKDGSADLQVYKGKTSLIIGSPGKPLLQPVTVTANQARSIDSRGENITEISYDPYEYVQAFDSKRGAIWKGQPLDLADIVGGGNGLKNGTRGAGIDPLSGRYVHNLKVKDRYGAHKFSPVTSSEFIDGVFVPDGDHPVVVSSEGHLFKECPDTGNFFRFDIVNTPYIPTDMRNRDRGSAIVHGLQATVSTSPLSIQGWQGNVQSSLFMHANLGITFDLANIREFLSTAEPMVFESVVGIAQYSNRPADADVWILVDGKVRFEALNLTEERFVDIHLELSSNDRFLTFVTTESGINPVLDVGMKADSDWCLFANPFLTVKNAK